MKRSYLISASIAVALLTVGCAHLPSPVNYPTTRRMEQTDNYHGTAVADPYRWLEDDNSPDTKDWTARQNEVTFAYLKSIPQRDAIKDRLTKLWNYERYGVPSRKGSRYFISRNNGLQNQSVLYSMDRPEAEPQVLLDPNTLSADGTVALASTAISHDGNLLAYALSASGSDWNEWKVRDVRTGTDLSDHLKWVKFSGAAWTKDNKGFFYSRYDEPKPGETLKGVNYYQKLYYHRLGTAQSEDKLIYHRPDQKEWGFGGSVTDDGNYLIISVWQGTNPKNRVFYLDLSKPDSQVVELLNDFDASYNFVENDGPVFWFLTDLNAPRGRLIAIDTTQPQRSRWIEVIPQTAETLQSVSVLNNQFVCSYLKDAQSQVKVLSLQGAPIRTLELPGIGSASGFGGERNDTETFFSFTSFTVPGVIYRHDLRTGQSTVFRQPKVDFDPADYETKQVFYSSKDGTRIPMFITHKRGLKLDGNNPTYLYGYGGFNISLTPSFSVSLLVWMERGGVYAMPNLRGGGEYGEEWHQAGTKLKKQNVFDDFISAAEWLIANRYTSSKKLAIAGGSNGGLLVGACMTQRPDLFAAALPAVGVLDMLRFQKFTIGWAWTSDYGSSDNPDEFQALHRYSPYHNLKAGTRYPSTLITTADHDDRVVPAHSFKFAARLQECHRGSNPVMIRVEMKAGHGAGKPTTKLIEESADKWAFLVRELDMR
jgi:prolyl oligopeptidase